MKGNDATVGRTFQKNEHFFSERVRERGVIKIYVTREQMKSSDSLVFDFSKINGWMRM